MRRKPNLALGVVFGIGLATFYSLYVVGLYLFRGTAPFEANETTLGAVVAVYYFGGATGGAIAGLLLPLTTWRIGSTMVGMIAGLPVCFGVGFAIYGPLSQWDGSNLFGVIATAVLLGGFGGYAFWEPVNPGGDP